VINQCPNCGSAAYYRDGFRNLGSERRQRFLCRYCGFRFSEPKTTTSTNNGDIKNRSIGVSPNSEECAMSQPVELQTAGDRKTRHQTADVKGKVVEHLWWLNQEDYTEETIKGRTQILKQLEKANVNLLNPDEVRDFIARQNWTPGRRANVIYAYALFAKWANIRFTLPRISIPEKLPFIPSEREIDDLIAATTKYIAAFLQLCKETGARSGEIFRLKWTDLDFENANVRIAPEKGSRPRLARLSTKAIQMLNQIVRNHDTVFLGRYKNSRNLLRTFLKQRKRIAAKMGNPRLQQIHFHTLRHWKATTEIPQNQRHTSRDANAWAQKNTKHAEIHTTRSIRRRRYLHM